MEMDKGAYGRSRPYYRDNFPVMEKIVDKSVKLSDFTDSTGATGYYDLVTKLPIGAIPLYWKAKVTTAFARNVAFDGDPTTLAFVDGGGSSDTITDSASGFVTDGFKTGDLISITGATTAGNNLDGVELTGAVAGTLTMATGTVAAAEAGKAGMTLTATRTVTGTLSVGVSGDTDRFSAITTGSVAALGTIGAVPVAADVAKGIAAEVTVRLTVAEAADFTLFTSGEFEIELGYVRTI
jgi:hypothetical protein